jgi:hypothetical protein
MIMYCITVFISAFSFFCAATAVAQPGNVMLHGVPLNAVDFRTLQKGKEDQPTPKGLVSPVQPTDEEAVHVALKDGARKLLFKGAPLKTENFNVKKDPDESNRRLAKEGSIRGGDIIDSVPREQSVHDLKKNSAFVANVVMPVQFQGKLEKTSGGSSRRLQDEYTCDPLDDGSLACCALNIPSPGWGICFICPPDTVETDDLNACSACAIVNENAETCNSCSTTCTDTAYSLASWDCSNLSNDECAKVDCDGNCRGSGALNPKSSASMTVLFLLATAVGALGLF